MSSTHRNVRDTKNLYNPLTGRPIQRGGHTHRRLLRARKLIDEALSQRGGAEPAGGKPGKTVESLRSSNEKFFKGLLEETRKAATSRPPITPDQTGDPNKIVLPKSKYGLVASMLPPAPEEHSWYHHHAPFYQNFGDYVCLKRDTLKELGSFLHDTLL